MTRELWMKGVPREVALTVIQQVFDEEGTDERLLAERVIEKKLPGLTNPPVEGPHLRRQLRDHLMRRGFDPQLVRELVETCVPDRKDAGSRPARWER